MSSNKYCVIMAGGIGTRFWPKSRQSMPKQFLDILGTANPSSATPTNASQKWFLRRISSW